MCRDCWLQLIDGNEGVAGLFFFFFSVRGARRKTTKDVRTSARPNLQKMWRVDRTALFFFFGRRSEPGTGAGPRLEKMCRDCWLQLIDGNEGVAGLFFFFFLYEGQGEKQPKMFEQVLGRTYRKCGGSTAPHFFFFFGRRSEPGTGAGPRLEKMCRDCWLQLIDGNEGVAGLFFFFFFSVRGARRKTTKDVRTSARPNLQKMWRVDRTALFFFFWKKVWTWNRCWASLRENV